MSDKNIIKFLSLALLNLLLLIVISTAQVYGDIYAVTLSYKQQLFAESLSLVNMEVAQGHLPDYNTPSSADYRLEVVSLDNKILKIIKFTIPKATTSFKGLTKEEAQTIPNDASFKISVPHFANAKIMRIYNSANIKVLEIPILSSITPIRNRQANSNIDWIYIALPIILILGFLAYTEMNRRSDHLRLMQNRKEQKILALKDFIATNLKKGCNKERIRNALTKNNYGNQEIEDAFREL